jgi:hypothetical protein
MRITNSNLYYIRRVGPAQALKDSDTCCYASNNTRAALNAGITPVKV